MLDAILTKSVISPDAELNRAKDKPVDLAQSARFLADYSAHLLGVGATTMRLEMNVNRMARAWGFEVDLFTLPRHIHLTLREISSAQTYSVTVAVPPVPIDFAVNTRLSNLSWKVADGKVDYDRAVALYNRIVRVRPQNHTFLLLAVAVANASFCRLFGGDFMAMIIVGIATFCGFFLKLTLLSHKLDIRFVVLVCAAVSSILAGGDYLFGLSGTPALAVGTSILYLVPGIPFINSFSDLFNRHYICAFSRFLDAVVLTACLSLGLCIGMALMKIGMF